MGIKRIILPIVMLFGMVFWPSLSHAAYTLKNGKLMRVDETPTMSVQDHYSAAIDAYQNKNWEEVVHHCVIVVKNFKDSPFAQEAYFYLGVSYFSLEEWEFSNRCFTKYLKNQSTPKFFEEAIYYKFKIAQQYQKGAKKHILGMKSLPKWVPAAEEAISIYDEVITALPHHDLAAEALFGKAGLLLKEKEYKSSTETYQVLIRRFPKHPLAAESYIGIGEVYLAQSQEEYPDQDFLDLAEINLRKFRTHFPGDSRVEIAEKKMLNMKEVYASDLYETGRFYERTGKPHAAYLYYTRIIAKYPETKVCINANKRLVKIPPPVQKTSAPLAHPIKEQSTQEPPVSPLLQLKVDDLTVDATPTSSVETPQ